MAGKALVLRAVRTGFGCPCRREHLVGQLREAIGRVDLIDDDRYRTNTGRTCIVLGV